jgi:opacity protein-like surface antigen
LPLLAITAALACPLAQADTDPGFYFGGGVGEANVRINDANDLTTAIERYDSHDTAWKAFLGWRFNPYFGAEVDYVNFGNPRKEVVPGVTVRTKVDGWEPYLVGTLPIGWFELFAKGGYLFSNFSEDVSTPLGSVSTSDSDQEFVWSGGVGLNVFERLNLRLEYETVDLKRVDDLHSLWLTAGWRF